MPKQNRKPGVHLHKTAERVTKLGTDLNEFYWILIAKNGKTIAMSFKPYKTKRATLRSMKITAEIFTGHKPIYYYDHTTGGTGVEEVKF